MVTNFQTYLTLRLGAVYLSLFTIVVETYSSTIENIIINKEEKEKGK